MRSTGGLDNFGEAPEISSRQAWAMVMRAFLSQNIANGCAFGAFGVSVLALQERYGSGRAEASMGLALALLAMSLASPVAGWMTLRLGLRHTMLIGAAASASGYFVLAIAPSMTVILAAYALLVGPGLAMFGSLPASVLAGGWMPQARGRAIGLASMPLLIAVLPLLGYAIISQYGLPVLYLVLAGLHMLLLPALVGVTEPPRCAMPAPGEAVTEPEMAMPTNRLLRRPIFWLIVLGGGVLNAIGIIGLTHLVALNVESGVSPALATMLVSIMGGASVAGSALAGLISDRIGGARTLALAAFGLAVSWSIIFFTSEIPLLAVAMLVIGACTAGVHPTITVIATRFLGASTLPRLLGYYIMFQLPFNFVLPPAAGGLRDAMQSYSGVILIVVAASGLIALVYLAISRFEMRIADQSVAL